MVPLLKRARSVLWRVAAVGLLLWWATSTGPLQAPVMWSLLGYLLVRASPGVVADIGRLTGARWQLRLPRFRDRGMKGQGLL